MKKQDFPLFKQYPELAYLDNAATSQKPIAVLEAESKYYLQANANVHRGIYQLSELATEMYEDARSGVAKFLHCDASEVIFTSGTTLSLNMLALTLPDLIIKEKSTDTILLTEMEHHSNILPWQLVAQKRQINLDYVKITPEYRLDLADLQKKLLSGNVKILSFTLMSNVLGTINPVKEIAALVRKISPNTKIVVDAAQAIAHLPVDPGELDIDFLAFSGHKIFGPTGIGVLYGKRLLLDKLEPPIRGGGMITRVERLQSFFEEAPAKFEAGTPNIAGAVGLAAALQYVEQIGWEKLQKYEEELTAYALEQLQSLEGVTIIGPETGKDRGSVISFLLEGVHPHDLAQILDEYHVCVRAGHHCNQILHREILKIPASVRASFSFYNDYQDVDHLKNALKAAGKLIRKPVRKNP